MPRIRLVTVIAVLALLAAGSCSSDEDGEGEAWEPCPETSEPVAHPTGEADVLLRVGVSGGLPLPRPMPDELPEVTLYGDGLLLAVGHGPGGPVPGLVERRLSEDEIQELLHLAETACLLDRDSLLELPETYDVPSVRFVVNAGGESHVTSAVGLGWSEMDPNVPASQEEQRGALLDVQAELLALAGAETSPAPIDRLGVFVADAEGPPTDESWPVVAWPLEQPLASFGTEAGAGGVPARCAVVTGADADALVAAVEDLPADRRPSWKDAGSWYQVYLRPMLPDETDCAALIA
jgi:hypothetical protein